MPTRRTFIKTFGCLSIGFTIGSPKLLLAGVNNGELPESLKRNPHINSWLEVLDNGRVRIFTGKLELGQCIKTAIEQVAAEELDHDIKNVEVVLADTGLTPNEGYTAGSGSMEQSAMAVRYASAAAKAKLLELASAKMKIPAEKITISNGYAQSNTGNKNLSFAELLAGKQLTGKVEAPVILKKKEEYKLVGKPIHRTDIVDMVKGKTVFVHDLRFDGMVHARIVRPPSYTSKLLQVDEAYVKKEAGTVLKIVRNGSFLGVIAKDEYSAIKAQRALRQSSKWSDESFAVKGDHLLAGELQKLPAETETVHSEGTINSTSFRYQAKYYKPYIMHGSIGPSCAIALYQDNKLHIWTHSQGVFPFREALSKMINIPAESIRVTGVPGSGCYGHNGADDVAADAALLALDYPGKHVRLQWMREDEHNWEPYGSAMIMEVAANLDNNGRISNWKYDLWSDVHSTRPGGNAENLLPSRYLANPFNPPSGGYAGGAYRNSEPYYAIPNQQVNMHSVKGPLRVSALRSLGAFANIFAIESFIDEICIAAEKDPFDFRIAHSTDKRSIAILGKLREMIKGEKPGEKEGIGIAFSRYKNYAAYCAVAAKVKVDEVAKKIRVLKMWASIDAGEAINTDGLINQTEGGMIQAASWTIMEEVKFDSKQITSSDWSTYPIMRFTDAPEVKVEVIARASEEVMGAGEAAQGPAAAAITNAIYRACGKRVRKLPAEKEVFGEK